MKILGLLLIITNSYFLFSQNDTIPLMCDKVVFKDGTTSFVQIQKVSSRKITYILCCLDCAVPREYKAKDVDTILFSYKELPPLTNKQEILIDSNEVIIDSIATFSVNIRTKTHFIMPGEKVSVHTTTDKNPFIRGTLDSIYSKSIFINGTEISIDSISRVSFKLKNKLTKSIGFNINDGLAYPGSIVLSNGEENHALMVGEKLSLESGGKSYKGILKSVNPKSIFINNEEILIETITSVKFRPEKRKKRLKQVIIFVLVDIPFTLTMKILIWLGADNAIVPLAIGIIAAPVLVTSGIVSLTKKNMKIDNGWELKVIK